MNFIFVTLANFFFFCNFSSFFLLPVLIEDMGGGESQIGYVMGSFGITSLLCIPFFSTLADRHGRKIFMIAGASLMTASSVCFIFVENLGPFIYALRLAQGAAFAAFFTAAATAVSEMAEKNRIAERLGFFGAFTIFSYAVGPPVGEWATDLFGKNGLFFYAASCGLISLAVSLFVREENFKRDDEKSFGSFFKFFVTRKYGVILFSNLAVAVGLGSLLNFFAVFARENGFPASRFFLTYALTVIVVRIFFSKLADKTERKKIASPAIFVAAAALVLLSRTQSGMQAALFCFLFSAGYGIMYPALGAMVADKTKTGMAKAMGAFNSSFSLGINYAAFPLGIIAESMGFRAMYALAGLVVFAGFVFFQIFEHGTGEGTKT